MSLSSGTRLGPYEVIAPIGSGGMGEVYRARDTKLKRDVAVKILPSAFSKDPDRLSRFQREAELLASLNHPAIGAIHGIEESNGVRAIVLELIEGPTLADKLSGGPLSWSETVDIARQIADALAAAHERGIIHRDLKPANIKITPDGKVKVLDFGLAKMLVSEEQPLDNSNSPTVIPVHTQEAVILGTAAYMSPEQARGRKIDKRTDVWSFGCVVYEMLTGRQTFGGPSLSDTISAIIKDQPDLKSLPAEIPAEIHSIIRACLEKDANRRLRDFHDVRVVLEHISANPPAGRSQRSGLRIPRLLWTASLALAVIIGLVAGRNSISISEPDAYPIQLTMLPPEGKNFAGTPFVSPDGRLVAFVMEGAIWIRNLDSTEPRRVASTEGAGGLFWSPDSRSLGYFSERKLKTIGIIGEPPRILADAANARGATWGREGTILYAPSTRSPIYRVSTAGGAPVQVTTLDPTRQEFEHFYPSLLPDGRHFVYLNRSSIPSNTGIYVTSIDGGTKPKRILEGRSRAVFAPPGYLLFGNDGTLMAQSFDLNSLETIGSPRPLAQNLAFIVEQGNSLFSTSTNGVIAYRTGGNLSSLQLTWFDRSGKQIGTIGDPGLYQNFRISPDARSASIDSTDPLSNLRDIWLMDLTRGTQNRLTFNEAQESASLWFPDGKKVLYYSNRDGPQNFYAKSASGTGNEEAVFKSEAATRAPLDFAPDGTLLFVQLNPNTGYDILSLSKDSKPTAYVDGPFDQGDARFSPDGKFVAYTSNETGRLEIWVQEFPISDKKLRISGSGGFWPRWRRDGEELFYISPDFHVHAVPMRLNGVLESGSPVSLFRVDLGITTGGVGLVSPFDVSPDGQRFLFIPPKVPTGPFTLLLNWTATTK